MKLRYNSEKNVKTKGNLHNLNYSQFDNVRC